MWEWRVFFQLSKESQPDVWDLLHCRPWSLFSDKRTDVYIVCSAASGVKLRGKKILEVKLRTARHASGAEHWEKTIHSSVRWDVKDLQALGKTIAKMMSEPGIRDTSSTRERLQSIEDVIALGSSPLACVSLNKNRTTHHLHGVGIEQTNITVDGFPGRKWRTVSFEGRLEDIEKLLQTKIKVGSSDAALLGEVSISAHLTQLAGDPCGYPEFVVKLRQELLEPEPAGTG